MTTVKENPQAQQGGDNENPGTNHNWLANAAETIRERTAKAKESGFESLILQVSVGDLLNEVKETLAGSDRGAFGRWCDEQGFDFDKSWRARLMKLAAHWEAAKAAMEAKPEASRKWTVDAVLRALAEAQKAEKAPDDGEGDDDDEGAQAAPKAKRMTEAEKLRQSLAEALERIKSLEGEIDALKGKANSEHRSESYKRAHEANEKRKAEHEARASAREDAAKIDVGTKTRARKVWSLYQRGATEGEKQAAQERLAAMADKFGMSFDAFVAACGLA